LRIRVKEYTTDKEILVLNSPDIIDYSPPVGAKVAGFITGFTAFALSPITIPIETNSIGNHAVDVLETSLRKMINNQTEQIYINRKSFKVN